MGRFEDFVNDVLRSHKRANINIEFENRHRMVLSCRDGKILEGEPFKVHGDLYNCGDWDYVFECESHDNIENIDDIYVILLKPKKQPYIKNDEDQPCLVIRCTKPMEPEELDELYGKILEQKKNGVILLPEFCAVITDNTNTEYKMLMNLDEEIRLEDEMAKPCRGIQNRTTQEIFDEQYELLQRQLGRK